MIRARTVRVVQAGWPQTIHVDVDRPAGEDEVDREILADRVESFAAGMQLAEQTLRARGLRVGVWSPIGPCVREALVIGGAA